MMSFAHDEIRNRGETGESQRKSEPARRLSRNSRFVADRTSCTCMCVRARARARRFSVKSFCGLKHDRPESVPSYVSIKHRPRRAAVWVRVRVYLTGRGRVRVPTRAYLDWFLRRNQEIINCPREAGITNLRPDPRVPPSFLPGALAGFCT